MQFRLTAFLCLLLIGGVSSTVLGQKTESKVADSPKNGAISESMAPFCLNASDMIIATGKPSLVTMPAGSQKVPVWSLSGGSVGQSVKGMVPGFPDGCVAVKVEIVVTTEDKQTSPAFEDVYRVHFSPMEKGTAEQKMKEASPKYDTSTPVRTVLPSGPFQTRTIVLESCHEVKPHTPFLIRIQREPGDPSDTFTRPTGLIKVIVTPICGLAVPVVVQDVEGYNSWPVIQSIGDKLVCVYSRGKGHNITEDIRAVYARTSTDNGKTWTPETVVADTPRYGEVTIGKGLDANGAMLLWVRRIGPDWNHDLYRSTDGVKFTRIASPKLDVMPIQITDVLTVPGVGLMSLWFAGNYGDNGPCHSWGTLTSKDNGTTWVQNVIESKLLKSEWPTEQSAVYLGDGRLLAIARSELGDMTTGRCQSQMISTDYGKTWKRTKTNIGDVLASTPSLILDKKTGLVHNYYYHRGKGVLRCRTVKPDAIFEHSLSWPEAQPISLGSHVTFDSGNVNATTLPGLHCLAFYSGEGKNTSVVVSIIKK